MIRVFVPFDLPVFRLLNSNHPLPVSLIQPSYDGIEFVRAGAAPALTPSQVSLHAADLIGRLDAQHSSRMVQFGDRLTEFIQSRDLASQAGMDTSADLAFFHTAPMHLDQMPWLIHIENIVTLFYPSLAQGDSGQVGMYDIPAYWFVRSMLESRRCRGLFTNLASTKQQVERVFKSEIIAAKTHHIRPGLYLTPEEEARIAVAVERKAEKPTVDILFTNSWHQGWANFFLRGGVEIVSAFLAIEGNFPNLRLTLRTVWPDNLKGSDLERRVRSHPKIALIEEPLPDDRMLDLFANTDIFALDAAGMHSVSILRAMYCAAACLVSDAPGYEDYVRDGESAVVLPGRRAAIYSEDPASGWLRDDYRPMFSIDPQRIQLTAQLLAALAGNPALRRTLGMNARRSILQNNGFAQWRGGFEKLVRGAAAA